MPDDIAESAEGRIWLVLRRSDKIGVGELAAITKFTPQYTRKALRGLERSGLAMSVEGEGLTLWSALGESWEVVRFVKTRDAVASSRARRAKCIKLWRCLWRSPRPMAIADLAEVLRYDSATIQAAVRQLKVRGCVYQAEGMQAGRSLLLAANGTPDEVREALAQPVLKVPEEVSPRFPRVNSVWALGSV